MPVPALPEKTYRPNRTDSATAPGSVMHYWPLPGRVLRYELTRLQTSDQANSDCGSMQRTAHNHQGLVVFSCDMNSKQLMDIKLTMCMPAHTHEQNQEIFREGRGETGSITYLFHLLYWIIEIPQVSFYQ